MIPDSELLCFLLLVFFFFLCNITVKELSTSVSSQPLIASKINKRKLKPWILANLFGSLSTICTILHMHLSAKRAKGLLYHSLYICNCTHRNIELLEDGHMALTFNINTFLCNLRFFSHLLSLFHVQYGAHSENKQQRGNLC